MLNSKYVGCEIKGINTPQVYVKTLHCATPFHQETLNTNALNLNIGPDDSTWWCIDSKYWRRFQDLLAARGFGIVIGSVWPNVKDLQEAGIPVIVITQKKGDLVVLSHSTIHWVRSDGTCNGLAWNFAPVSYHMMTVALNRVKLNKIVLNKSIIPLSQLIWNLVKEKFPFPKDDGLYYLIK